MNVLVKIIRDEDRNLTLNDSWHLVDPCNFQGSAALCTGEFFGGGESIAEFEMKEVSRGGITCPKCIQILKIYKAVKL